MTSKDKQIWETYAQGLVLVQKKRRKPSLGAPTLEKPAVCKRMAAKPASLAKSNTKKASKVIIPNNLERKREKFLRQGNVEIEATLDLHGMTQSEAFDALSSFMRQSLKMGRRHLLIITGKGRLGTGVLRSNLKNWLGQLPEISAILAIRPAAPKHGGDGAFYVVMRKH